VAQFTDNAGRPWEVTVHVGSIKRVRSLLGVDLMDVVQGSLMGRLAADPVLLCDVLYALCKPEADSCGVSDEEFGRSMAGDVIEDAAHALTEELVRFFPNRRRRLMEKAAEKLRVLEGMALDAAEAMLESGELDEKLRAALAPAYRPAGKSGDLSMSSPESVESTPAP
jgi:hypothetical protein